MKYVMMLILFAGTAAYGQDNKHSVTVAGRVKNGKVFYYNDLTAFQTVRLDSMPVYSHLMALHGVTRNIKGVLLKELLKGIEFDAETPKVLSEYYIICMAADNYKVVFSWNEVFNSAVGDKLMLAIERDGSSVASQKDGLVLLSATDRATGRRFVKGLNRIIIQRVN